MPDDNVLSMGPYRILEQLYKSHSSAVFRAIPEENTGDSETVILKLLNEAYPSPEQVGRFRREFELTRGIQGRGIRQALDLFRYENTLVMVLEDFGGRPLSELYENTALSVDKFLPLAIRCVEALAEVHRAEVIHKGINPSNLLLNPFTGELKIIDFGLASEQVLEIESLLDPSQVLESLAFVSPEQTGRIDQAPDYRSDFYSLGMTFYQLLMGRLPFESDDPMQWVHWHIAQEVVPLTQENPAIPVTISNMVTKLLSKAPEHRYASDTGLLYDLKRCLAEYQEHGTISYFDVGLMDVASHFQLPQTLYGRDAELGRMLKCFNQISEGEKHFVSVVGPSGIGKTALIQGLFKPLVAKRCFFVSGKFDQLDRNTPYSSFVSAIRELASQILGLDDEQINEWKRVILRAVGRNGRLVTEIIPELEPIIGPQPALQKASSVEIKNRFHLTFQRFVRAFCSMEHPMVMVLDDMQWADSASIALIESLLLDPTIGHLMIVASFRDNEVDEAHPLSALLQTLESKEVRLSSLNLNALSLESIAELLADALKCRKEQVLPLAERCQAKTMGNPFFLTQFIAKLNAQDLLYFDHASGGWKWRLDDIDRQHTTDNVIDLMVEKIGGLSPFARQLICSAAGIGNQFDVDLLARVNGMAPENVATGIWELLFEGLLVPVDGVSITLPADAFKRRIVSNHFLTAQHAVVYRFTHDRVQQAAYLLLSDEHRGRLHESIGSHLLAEYGQEGDSDVIFNIANHLNLAKSYVGTCRDPVLLATLNLKAGKRAKASAAFSSAYGYFRYGVSCLEASCWETHRSLQRELHQEAMDLACLNADFSQMDMLATILLRHSASVIEKIPVHQIRIRAFISRDDCVRAVDEARTALAALGVVLPESPTPTDVENALVRIGESLASRSPVSLLELPHMSAAEPLAATQILHQILSAAYQTSPLMFPVIVSAMIELSIKHGNSPGSPFAYASYGLVLSGIVGDVHTGYQFGQLGIRLLDQFEASEFKAKTLYVAQVFVNHWKLHIGKSIVPLKTIYETGMSTGDFEYAGWAAMMVNVHGFFAGKPLPDIEKETLDALLRIGQLNQNTASFHTRIFLQMIAALREAETSGNRHEPEFFGRYYQPGDSEMLHQVGADRTALCIEHFTRMVHACLLGNTEEALKQSELAETFLDGLVSSAYIPQYYFYDSLTHLALYHAAASHQDESARQHLDRVRANQEKLGFWAEHCHENYGGKFRLVEAELAAASMKTDLSVIELYQSAISMAMEHGVLHEEALANELLGRYLLAIRQRDFAKLHLTRAYHLYRQWGAEAKLTQLVQKHPLQLAEFLETRNNKQRTSVAQAAPEYSNVLDFYSVMKAMQTISGEIVLHELLDTMMTLVLENAGAQKGILLLVHELSEGRPEWFLEVIAQTGEPAEHCSVRVDFESENRLPVNIVQRAIRSRASLVLSDASSDAQYARNDYVAKQNVKSVLCSPIIHRGELSGVIYLENNATTGAFTERHLSTVQLLATQTAISLENARLYAGLEERVALRTQELMEANDKLTELATIDSLTKAMNRRHFMECARKEIERANRFQRPVSVIMLDIDHFKQVNDTYGHAAGDEVLRQVAAICRENLREQDLFGRLGGEEFAIVAPEIDLTKGEQLSERIRRSVAEARIEALSHQLQVTVSIGVSALSKSSDTMDRLLHNADLGLYQSKENGRNRVSSLAEVH